MGVTGKFQPVEAFHDPVAGNLCCVVQEQRCGNYEQARSVFRQALEHHPYCDQVVSSGIRLNAEASRYRSLFTDSQRCLAQAMAWGLLESKQGLPMRAKLLLERAAILNPSRNIKVPAWLRGHPTALRDAACSLLFE